MITSLTKMLELLNFGHMTRVTLQSGLRDKILLMMPWTEIMMP